MEELTETPALQARCNGVELGRNLQALWLLRAHLLLWSSFKASNSTATSDSCTQKLGNDVLRDSESIATKVCSQIGRKQNAMFESHVD